MSGKVPEGWEAVRASRLFSLAYGRALPADARSGNGLPVYGSAGVVGLHREPAVPGPGVVVGRKGTAGAVHWVDSGFTPIDTTYFVERNTDVDWLWLYYGLCSWNLPSLCETTGVPGLNRERVASLRVLLPPLAEQKKIAAILSSVDEAIQATQRVIDQTRRVKEGLLQDLLTRGLPGHHTRFKQTEIGEIPEEWEVILLDSVAQRGSGHTPDKKHSEYWGGNIWWVSLADSHRLDAVYLSETTSKITPLGVENSSAVLHPVGTVFVSRDASVGRSAIAAVPLAVSQHFIAWRCGSRLNNHFLYYCLQHHKRRFEQIAAGSTIKTIGLGYFKAFRISLPPLREQQDIAARLFALDQAMWCYEGHCEHVKRVKAGLLQGLLTGKVRVIP